MTDKEIRRKLNQLAKLANELDAEAKARYGEDGFLFYEAGGVFSLMDGDDERRDTSSSERQTHVRFSSTKTCHMGAGAW